MTSSSVIRSLCSMWMAEVARNTWMRGRAASLTASQARSMSASIPQRARPAMTGPRTSRAMRWTAAKSPSEEIGNPASMMSTPRAASWLAMAHLVVGVEGDSGRLLAVSQGGVEDEYSVGHDGCSWARERLTGFSVAGSAKAARPPSAQEMQPICPPKGGEGPPSVPLGGAGAVRDGGW